MKNVFLFCILFFLCALTLSGQTKSQVVKLSSGDTITHVVRQNVQYAFDDFTEGTVLFKSGTASKARLNYNYLLGELQFIDPGTNKVMALVNLSDVVMITVSGRQFIQKEGTSEFMEILFRGSDVSLCVSRKGELTKVGKEGAYGIVSASSSIVSAKPENNGEVSGMEVKEHIDVRMENSYYLYADGKRTLIKNGKNFTKLFPKDKAPLIEKYIVDNKVNFKKEEELIRLSEYCNQL